jgi:hypothetical protein
MTTQTETTQRNHHRAVRFFWGFLIGATIVSLTGNVVHAMLPYIPPVAVQIGAAAVPPIALLAAVHGIALAVRAGASGRVYCWAVSAVAVIGLGAFTVSFLALSGLMQAIGYSSTTAWIFPAIIDTAVAVSTFDVGCARGQASPAHPPCDHVAQYTSDNDETVGAISDAECKIPRHTVRAGQWACTDRTSRGGTDLCIGTTRSGTDCAELSANRGDTGRRFVSTYP